MRLPFMLFCHDAMLIREERRAARESAAVQSARGSGVARADDDGLSQRSVRGRRAYVICAARAAEARWQRERAARQRVEYVVVSCDFIRRHVIICHR